MKSQCFFLFYCLLFVFSCDYIERFTKGEQPNSDEKNSDTTKLSMLEEFESQFAGIQVKKDTIQEPVKMVHYTPNRSFNAFAKFISGVPNTDTFASLQEKEFFMIHKNVTDKEWKATKSENLYPIGVWIDENNITGRGDSLTLLYPFSGPDFLYANAFFPYSKNFILIGLEKLGSLPGLEELNDTTINNYLTGIRYSLRYINKVGYFTTNQMRSDFSDITLDGVIHIILFYIVRTGHDIVDISNVYIDSSGKDTPIGNSQKNKGVIKALKIQFTDNTLPYLKTLYYFRLNLENTNVDKHPEFVTFLNNSGRLITYIKSGSYILHHKSFSRLRDIILAQSNKILQDDTGIPYDFLNTPQFDLKLFGKYTRTISDFEYNYQPKLKEALENQKENKYLPFRLGYNAWHDETVLLYACAKSRDGQKPPDITTHTEDTPLPAEGVVFRVQILTSVRLIDKKHYKFEGLPNVSYYMIDGTYKYTVGNEKDMETCKELQKLARDKGFKDAFMIALYNNQRITLDKAMQLKDQVQNP